MLRHSGEIAHTGKAIERCMTRLCEEVGGGVLCVCYEAGPCGYPLQRQITALGHHCQVIAPSLIPKKPGERIKTDRRDALKLAQFLRNGDLTEISYPPPG